MTTDDMSFDEAVQEFLRVMVVPRRLREARVSGRLAEMEPTMVPTRWGDVATWRLGSGPAVLLVHGWEDDNSLWSPLIDELHRRHRSLVAFDLPGHGASGGDWAIFEGSDAIKAVSEAFGPVHAVVAHSAGCGMAVGAMGEGWAVERAVFIAPPLAPGDRWRREAERLGVPDEVAVTARATYDERHGPARAAWQARTAYPALDVDLLVIHSRDDERHDVADTQTIVPSMRRAELVLVDGLTHRRTARDRAVINIAADFVTT